MIKKVGVLGGGIMGSGIAQVLASSGLSVRLVDANAAQLDKSLNIIKGSLSWLKEKGKLDDTPEQVLQRLTTASDIDAMHDVDMVVEAVPENEQLKLDIFRQLDKITPAHAILATNTSSISITRLAAATNRPAQCIGMHFMNPVPIMTLVEIIRGLSTSEETFVATRELAMSMGKATCVSQDRPGFIVNRILMPYVNEAFFALMEGVATAEDIDIGMKLGTNVPMGPLKLADFIGLDTCLAIMRVLQNNLGDDKYRPCPLLVQYVDAGLLGKKTGRGVYEYPAKSSA